MTRFVLGNGSTLVSEGRGRRKTKKMIHDVICSFVSDWIDFLLYLELIEWKGNTGKKGRKARAINSFLGKNLPNIKKRSDDRTLYLKRKEGIVAQEETSSFPSHSPFFFLLLWTLVLSHFAYSLAPCCFVCYCAHWRGRRHSTSFECRSESWTTNIERHDDDTWSWITHSRT